MGKIGTLIIGFITGIVDAVPGVSGATMLLVFGVYEKTVSYSYSFLYEQIPSTISDIKNLEMRASKNNIRYSQLIYLIVLLAGIFIGLISSFLLFDKLLERNPSSVFGLFTGLILGSSYIILNRNNKIKDYKNLKWVVAGVVVSCIIVLLSLETGNSLPVLLISGFIASFGMLLPGLSGSFLLLVIGKYSFITDLVGKVAENPSSLLGTTGLQILILGLGGITGVVFNLKTVSYFIERNRTATLSVILGLVIGGLLAPINEYLSLSNQDPVLFTVFFVASLIGVLTISYAQYS